MMPEELREFQRETSMRNSAEKKNKKAHARHFDNNRPDQFKLGHERLAYMKASQETRNNSSPMPSGAIAGIENLVAMYDTSQQSNDE